MLKIRGSSRKGSLITETAIFLPVFIISVLVLSALIKSVCLQVSVFEALSDEGRKLSVQAYAFDRLGEQLPESVRAFAADAADPLIYTKSIKSALEKRGVESDSVRLISYEKDSGEYNITNLTRAQVSYDMEIPLPISNIHEINIVNISYYREWDGEDLSGEVFSFERMATDEDGSVVCIFPHAGDKYHTSSCRYVKSYAYQAVVTREILKKYDSCPLCMDDEAQVGDTVYLFRYGNSYHSATCAAVDKYVIEMDRQDAVQKGYTACSVCGG